MVVNNNTKIFVGDTEIVKAYKGDTVIYEKGEQPEYTEVNYLENPGYCYIQTGVIINDNKLRVQMKVKENTNYHEGFPLGGYNGSYGMGDIYGDKENYYWYFYYGNNPSIQTNLVYNPYEVDTYTLDYTLTKDTYSLTSNGETDSGTRTSFVPTNSELYMFRRGTDASYEHVGRIYYCKIYVDDVLVRDYIPVLDANSVPCMYDKVSKQYFYNGYSGNTFLYG